jgi:hypothetical protein
MYKLLRMGNMIRKQLYINAKQQEKLQRIAKRNGCSEAAILREAIDRLPEYRDPIEQRLAEAGALARPPKGRRKLTPEEGVELERRYYEWARSLPEPLGLSEIVIQDRR